MKFNNSLFLSLTLILWFEAIAVVNVTNVCKEGVQRLSCIILQRGIFCKILLQENPSHSIWSLVKGLLLNVKVYIDIYPSDGDLFRLLANFLLLYCSDLAVLIFPTLLADIQRPNWKSAQGPRDGNTQLFNPFTLYFT